MLLLLFLLFFFFFFFCLFFFFFFFFCLFLFLFFFFFFFFFFCLFLFLFFCLFLFFFFFCLFLFLFLLFFFFFFFFFFLSASLLLLWHQDNAMDNIIQKWSCKSMCFENCLACEPETNVICTTRVGRNHGCSLDTMVAKQARFVTERPDGSQRSFFKVGQQRSLSLGTFLARPSAWAKRLWQSVQVLEVPGPEAHCKRRCDPKSCHDLGILCLSLYPHLTTKWFGFTGPH